MPSLSCQTSLPSCFLRWKTITFLILTQVTMLTVRVKPEAHFKNLPESKVNSKPRIISRFGTVINFINQKAILTKNSENVKARLFDKKLSIFF